MQTKLRIGLAEPTLLTALGYAAVRSEKHSSRLKSIANSDEEVSH